MTADPLSSAWLKTPPAAAAARAAALSLTPMQSASMPAGTGDRALPLTAVAFPSSIHSERSREVPDTTQQRAIGSRTTARRQVKRAQIFVVSFLRLIFSFFLSLALASRFAKHSKKNFSSYLSSLFKKPRRPDPRQERTTGETPRAMPLAPARNTPRPSPSSRSSAGRSRRQGPWRSQPRRCSGRCFLRLHRRRRKRRLPLPS